MLQDQIRKHVTRVLTLLASARNIAFGRLFWNRNYTITIISAALTVLTFATLVGGNDIENRTILKLDSIGTNAAPLGKEFENSDSLIAANGVPIRDPAITEVTPDGPLPKVGKDGQSPMTVYAKRTDKSDPRPKIAIVVGGLGLSHTTTQTALQLLDPNVTLAFSPYGKSIQGAVSAARARSHEVLMEIPLEPFDYPNNDPGQNTLLTGTKPSDNRARMHWVLSRASGYAGVVNVQGSKFLSSPPDVSMLLTELQNRGLYFVDNAQFDQSIAREIAGKLQASFARITHKIDTVAIANSIDARLRALEDACKLHGNAIGFSSPYPISLERISVWASELDQKGIALVPLSALIESKPVHQTKSRPPAISGPKAKALSSSAHAEPQNVGPHP